MLKLQDKINLAYEDLELKESEEKVIISIVGKVDLETLKTTTCVIVRGNKLTQTKIIRELLNSGKTKDLALILEMVKENI